MSVRKYLLTYPSKYSEGKLHLARGGSLTEPPKTFCGLTPHAESLYQKDLDALSNVGRDPSRCKKCFGNPQTS